MCQHIYFNIKVQKLQGLSCQSPPTSTTHLSIPPFPPKKHLKIILCVVNSEVFTGSHTIYDSYLEMKGNI